MGGTAGRLPCLRIRSLHAGGLILTPGRSFSVVASNTSEFSGAKPISHGLARGVRRRGAVLEHAHMTDARLHHVEDLASHGLDLRDAAGKARRREVQGAPVAARS